MGRKILGVIVGFIIGGIAVGAVHFAGHVMYPPPPGLDYNDAVAVKKHIDGLTAGPYAFVLAAHACGPFVGALICAVIVRGRWWVGPIIIGVLFTLAGISNFKFIPAPVWFIVVDTAMYVPFALLGAWLGMRMVGTR